MKKISRRSFLTAMAAVSAAGVLAACGASSSTASSVVSSVAASSEAATSSEAVPESVTIKAFNGAKESVDVEVPFDPQRIAILELASLDILDELGVGDRVVGTATTSLDYLQSYVTNDSIANLGNIKEADMEAVMACEPDIIFIGGRLSKAYDALCEIAPVVFLSTDAEKGVMESTRENALTIASIFGLEDQVESLMADFDSRIDALKAFAEGKTAIVGMTTSGSFNVLGNDGRCSIIGKEIGFENIGVDANIDTSTHGNEASFEFIVDKNPDYIFAMDRDAAIGTDSAQLAQEILENELVEMPIRPLLYTMAVPLMLSLLIQSLYNIVDSIFVARLSETALTAASLVYAIQFLMIAIGVGTAVGLNALLSRKLGQKKPEEACRSATTGLFLMLGTSLVFTLVGLLFSNRIAAALTNDPELQQLCREYLSVNLVQQGVPRRKCSVSLC